MSRFAKLSSVAASLFLVAGIAQAKNHGGHKGKGPCMEEHKKFKAAKKEAHACMKAWEKFAKSHNTKPGDDCSAKTAAFVAAAEAMNTCRGEHAAKKEDHKAMKKEHAAPAAAEHAAPAHAEPAHAAPEHEAPAH